MTLHIQNDDRNSAILVCDENQNDVAEFYHCEHATVTTTYERALDLAHKLIDADDAPMHRLRADAYRCALLDIRAAHVPSQPVDSQSDEVSWIMRHIGEIRRIAAKALEL